VSHISIGPGAVRVQDFESKRYLVKKLGNSGGFQNIEEKSVEAKTSDIGHETQEVGR
jgi:hypothetical protein